MPDIISSNKKDVPTTILGLDVDQVSEFNEGDAYIPVDIKACIKSVKLKILFSYHQEFKKNRFFLKKRGSEVANQAAISLLFSHSLISS